MLPSTLMEVVPVSESSLIDSVTAYISLTSSHWSPLIMVKLVRFSVTSWFFFSSSLKEGVIL